MTERRSKDGAQIFDFIVIGAGISGLYAARELQKRGLTVLVLEKSKSVGGRMATRRFDDHSFDHGAQFVDFNDPALLSLDQELAAASITKSWFQMNERWMKSAPGGMTQITKYLAQHLNILFLEKVVLIESDSESLYCIHCESQKWFRTENIVLSCPLPQSLEILSTSKIEFPGSLGQLSFAPAIVGLFALSDCRVHFTEFLHRNHWPDDIESISNQQSKSVSSHPAFTLIMNAAWSLDFFSKSDNELAELLKEKFLKHIGSLDQFKISQVQVKKWKMSYPRQIFERPFFSLSSRPSIFLIGDAFGGASVGGAVESARAFIEHV